MTKVQKVKILLVDDHPLVRIGLRAELKKNKDFEIIGEAKTGREAVKKSIQLKPDIVLLDISLPDINGLEAASIILKKLPDTKIVAITMYDFDDYITEMMRLGAHGYILKDSPPEELFNGIREVLKGKKYLDKNIKAKVKARKTSVSKENVTLLTRRELEILKNVANGLNNKTIADNFFISVRTVESHRNKIKKKLNITSTAQLTLYALKNKLINNATAERPLLTRRRKSK
ncbi:MAG: response regulator transcription factor [bacterium]